MNTPSSKSRNSSHKIIEIKCCLTRFSWLSSMHPSNALQNPIGSDGSRIFGEAYQRYIKVQSWSGGSFETKPCSAFDRLLTFIPRAWQLSRPSAAIRHPYLDLSRSARDRCLESLGYTGPSGSIPNQTRRSQIRSPANGSTIESPQPKSETDTDQTGTQTKRILWIVPNFRSVSANTHLPPQSTKEKFWLATQESFDYSAFIYEGIVAGIAMADKSEPSFGQGAVRLRNLLRPHFCRRHDRELHGRGHRARGHQGRSSLLHPGPRRLLQAHWLRSQPLGDHQNDSGNDTFNFSEIVGAGAAAGISNLYYPPGNTWVKTYQRWGSQIFRTALSFIAKEFWPDVNHAVFHNKY